jgi:uncharacterized protein (DUF433 family)
MNNFDIELQELIDRWRDYPAVTLEEIIDALNTAVEKLAEEVNARAA